MLAIAMVAFFAAAAPLQEGFEEIEDQDLELGIYEDCEGQDVVLNEEGEYAEEIVFEDENESSKDMVACEDEE
jgi:hypothetical protein